MIMCLAEPFLEQRVKDMVRGARENAEPQECRQKGRKTCLHLF